MFHLDCTIRTLICIFILLKKRKKNEGICTVVHELINSKLHDSSFQPFVPSSESIISYDSDDSMLSEDSEREDTEDEDEDEGDRPKTL